MNTASSLKELKEYRECNALARIVLAGGIFDLFHAGHAKYLNFCKRQGELLVVHVGSDKSSIVYKNGKKPVISEEHRVEIVKNFRAVDLVYSDDRKHRDLLIVRSLRPDVMMLSKESTSEEEISELRKEFPNMQIIFNPRIDDGLSTTSLIAKIKEKHC